MLYLFSFLQSSVVIRKLMLYTIPVAIFFFCIDHWYDKGVKDTTLKFQRQMEEQREEIEAVNKEVLEETRLKITELKRMMSSKDETISQLLEEAQEDADSGSVSLGTSSVRRINQIK